MAFKPVVQEVVLITLKELPDRNCIVLKKGDYVDGYYLGVQSHSKVSQGFVALQGEDGKLMSIINYKGLEWQIKRVPVGTLIRIEYEGKKKTGNGREFHSFVVYVDTEKRIDTATANDILEKIAQEASKAIEASDEDIDDLKQNIKL